MTFMAFSMDFSYQSAMFDVLPLRSCFASPRSAALPRFSFPGRPREVHVSASLGECSVERFYSVRDGSEESEDMWRKKKGTRCLGYELESFLCLFWW